ncbi:pentatricopeptide repeat-containing family protein [Salix suchowensis]|nr:pentatricopeptide repeat-containing family protein [Salix suchowensis]
MEATQTQSPAMSIYLHFFPPSPLNHHSNNIYKIKSYKRTQPIQALPIIDEKDAFPASLPLYKKNPRAIYKDIQRFARRTQLKEALTIMDYMDQQGIPFKPITFSSLEAACIRSKSLTKAKEIRKWLENNELLRTKLVQNYVSNGRLEQALRSAVWMQQERSRPDVVKAAIVISWKGDSCFCCQEPVLAYRKSFAMRLSITEKPTRLVKDVS